MRQHGRDRCVLSKGHAAAAMYSVLVESNELNEDELARYGLLGSRLAGHPLRGTPGIEFPTGSLGHGLSVGLGMALALRLDGDRSRFFVVMGDGELQEGSVWEAAMSAARFGVGQLIAVIDRNRLQINGAFIERFSQSIASLSTDLKRRIRRRRCSCRMLLRVHSSCQKHESPQHQTNPFQYISPTPFDPARLQLNCN